MRWIPCLVVLAGCFASGSARVASIGPRGTWTVMATLPVVGYAPGRTAGRSGNSAASVPGPGFLNLMTGLWGIEVDTSVAVGSGCEVGAIVGLQKLGGEARCQLLGTFSEPSSIAASPFVRGGYAPGPLWVPSGPWFATGVDLSRGFGSGVAALAFSPSISFGVESHGVVEPAGPGIDQENFASIGRREWRVNLPVGIGFAGHTSAARGVRVMVGVAPYWTVSHGAPFCTSSCTSTDATTFEESWGMLFTLGVGPVPLPRN